jgi:outer membrane lipoprotein
MRKTFICLLPLTLLVAGCAHWIGEQSRALADRSITFSQLRENPDACRGKLVLLGGVVASTVQPGEGTLLEVVEHRLDSRELPDQVIPSRGRFLASSPGRLDPARFKPGALVSMMGEVVGKKVQLLDGKKYAYPVIAVREIHAIELPEIHPEHNYGDRHGLNHVW